MKQQTFRKIMVSAAVITLILMASPASARASASLPDSSLSGKALLAADPERIRFARGTTGAVVSGEIGTNQVERYILRAMAGQLMEVDLSAPDGVRLTVATAGGRELEAISDSATRFRGYLPRTGDYILTVTSRSRPGSYSLRVSIPERVSFERGTTSAAIKGDLEAQQSHEYILRAQAGQILEINATPEDDDSRLQMIIYGADGSVLKSGMGEGSSFRGELPLSEDYIVALKAGGEDISYTMDVIIPRRIRFQPGAFSDTQRGWLNAHRSQYYSLRAMKGQDMRVEVTSGEAVQLIVYGVDGTVLKSGMGEGASFRGELPSTQDYILVVRSGAYATSFRVWVRIE